MRALAYCTAMKLRPALACMCLVALCLAATGCGSDDTGSGSAAQGEEAAVSAAVKRYLAGMGGLDPAAVCASLTPAGRRDLVSSSGSKERSCEEVLRLGFQLLSGQQKQILAAQAALEPYDVVVSGRNAVGKLQYQGQVTQFQAEKSGGVWRLSSPGDRQIVLE